MKLRLPRQLSVFLLSAMAASAYAEVTNDYTLGNVMYVGDSITHGYGSASYRWAMHKILVDNGISYKEEGINTGNSSNGVAPRTPYGGVVFQNVHSSQASGRAWEISGNASYYDSECTWKHSGGTRYEKSNIMNWLGQSDLNNVGKTYTGATFTGVNTPDRFFLMIGTNDLLSDVSGSSDTFLKNKDAIIKSLLTDIDAIYDSMIEANGDAKITLSLIPAFCQTNWTPSVHEGVKEFNDALTKWAADKKGVTTVDVNKGMADVTSSTVLYAVPNMVNSGDKLHPTQQGDLIIAGNMAKAMGLGGRTAGKERKAGTEFATVAAGALTTVADYSSHDFSITNVKDTDGKLDFSAAGASTLSYDWGIDAQTDKGFTVDFALALGNGETGGWNTSDNFSVVIGNGAFSGTLNINEAYIKWGDSVLYSDDLSANKDKIRISYVYGSATDNLTTGYYVWLDDMLIGEGLGYTADTAHNGVTFSYSGTGSALLSQVALDSTAAYAPSTTRLYNEESHYIAPVRGEFVPGPGTIKNWADGVSQNATIGSGNGNLRSASSFAGGDVAITATLAPGASTVYGNTGNYTGNVWAEITSGSASGWYAAHGANAGASAGTLTGNAYLKLSDAVGNGGTVFGAVNATKVTGDVYVEISAGSASFGSFTASAGQQSSLVGAFRSDIGGSMTFVVNAGSFNYDIRGGIHSGTTNSIGGGTKIYFNGGEAKGAIYGGGREGTINNGTDVIINGGSVAGKVYGGGSGGTINGGTMVTLNGGSLNNAVFGGGADGTIEGDTTVSVLKGSYTRNIHGGGEGGTISGTAKVLVGGENTVVTGYIVGAGSGGTVKDTLVQITEGSVGYVFGGGLGGKVTGNTSVIMTGGQASNLFGGSMSGSGGDVIDGSTSVRVTGGTVTGEVAGGCATRNSSQKGDSTVRILGGKVKDVYGGSNAGDVGGSTYVELGVADKQGGFITEVTGNVYGGNKANYSIGGDSTVAITDIDVIVGGTTINAGSAGSIAGNTQLLLSNIKSSASRSTRDISHYSGTFDGGSNVTGTRTLKVSDVQNDFSEATITNFDRIEVSDGSEVTFKGTGGASVIDVQNSLLNLIVTVEEVMLSELSVQSSAVVGLYTTDKSEANVKVSGSLKAGTNGTLNANLTMAQGSSITLEKGGLLMGSTLDLNEGITLNLSSAQQSALATGSSVTLFSGVDAVTLAGTGYSDYTGEISTGMGVDATSIFTNLSGLTQPVYLTFSGADNGGVLALCSTPEPATATLSLLALAGLAARRRRK